VKDEPLDVPVSTISIVRHVATNPMLFEKVAVLLVAVLLLPIVVCCCCCWFHSKYGSAMAVRREWDSAASHTRDCGPNSRPLDVVGPLTPNTRRE
jgi:hypothetical protein